MMIMMMVVVLVGSERTNQIYDDSSSFPKPSKP